MIAADVRDHRHKRGAEIRRVQTPSETNFQNRHIAACLFKDHPGQRGRKLKKSRSGLFTLLQVVGQLLQSGNEPDDGLLRGKLTIHGHSLLEPHQMRRGKQSHAMPRSSQDRRCHHSRRALAFGPRDVDNRDLQVRISEPLQQGRHPPQLKIRGGVFGGRHPLVVDPAEQIVNSCLVTEGRCRSTRWVCWDHPLRN